jgi:hypothetical protein
MHYCVNALLGQCITGSMHYWVNALLGQCITGSIHYWVNALPSVAHRIQDIPLDCLRFLNSSKNPHESDHICTNTTTATTSSSSSSSAACEQGAAQCGCAAACLVALRGQHLSCQPLQSLSDPLTRPAATQIRQAGRQAGRRAGRQAVSRLGWQSTLILR